MSPTTLSLNDGDLEAREENFIAVIALIILLIFFLAYCCWGTSYCKKFCSGPNFFQRGDVQVPENGRNISVDQPTGNPTIILLPHGRILVVDGTVFARFHADNAGLDLFELGDRVLRDERSQMTRSPSLDEFDSGGNSKDCTSSTASTLPPTYESIFGDYQLNAPPSYSESFRNDVTEASLLGVRVNEEINIESSV